MYSYRGGFLVVSIIAREASMAMKKTSGGDSPLQQGVGKIFWTLPISGR
jgi:hypothetical protein